MKEENTTADKQQPPPTLRKFFNDKDIVISYVTGKIGYFEKGKLVEEYEREHIGYQRMREKLNELEKSEQYKRAE